MTRTIVILIISEKHGWGKSHLAMATGDSCMIDMTPSKDAEIPAQHVYKDEFDDRYIVLREYNAIVKEIERVKYPVVCLDTGDCFRDVLKREYLVRHNAERAKKKKSPVSTVYPQTEWGAVYDIGRDFFYDVCDNKSIVVTEGVKEKYKMNDELGKVVPTGKSIPDGLKILPGIADIVLNVVVDKKGRRVDVLKNRFMDIASDDFITPIESVNSLVDRMIESGVVKKGMIAI